MNRVPNLGEGQQINSAAGGQRFISDQSDLKCVPKEQCTKAVNVKLPASLVQQAKRHARLQHRSVPKQIEHWTQIGKIAEENPNLPFALIRDILIARHEEAREIYKVE